MYAIRSYYAVRPTRVHGQRRHDFPVYGPEQFQQRPVGVHASAIGDRVNLHPQRGAVARTPGNGDGVAEVADVLVEELVLVAEGRHEAARMGIGQVGHHLGEHLETDEEAMIV